MGQARHNGKEVRKMKIGFVGAGNMAEAIIKGAIGAEVCAASDITASDMSEARLSVLSDTYGINTTMNNSEVMDNDMVFLCVKPNVLYDVIAGIKDSANENTIIISIAAGQSLEKITAAFGSEKLKLVRVMPNTPALVGEGMAAVVPNDNLNADEAAAVTAVFNSFGKAEIVKEGLMDAVTAVSGSSPAYVFMFIEAMADAAVKGGMPRKQAYTFAAQSVLGSAKMVLDTEKHPGELKDMVCSPAGTTIDAVEVLENEGMRSAVMKAMDACIEKSRSL